WRSRVVIDNCHGTHDNCQSAYRPPMGSCVPVLEVTRILRETSHMRTLTVPFCALTVYLATGVAARAFQPQSQAVTPERSNAVTCLRGLAGCDISALNPEELRLVATESKKRNLDYCLSGSSL